MADRETGRVRVNGETATELHYTSRLESGELREVEVRFLNDRREVAQARLDREQAIEALGLRNLQTIESRASRQAEGAREEVKGVLRGRSLERREVVLSAASNAVEYATPERERITSNREATAVERKSIAAAGAIATGVGVAGLGGTDAQVASTAARFAAAIAAVAAFLRRDNSGQREEESVGRKVAAAQSGPREELIATRRSPDTSSVPDAVLQRYLKVNDRYYFPDRTLAFSDGGTKLKAETENKEVIRTLVEIARERQWEAINVRGSEAFRREVWRQGSVAGLEVRGYDAAKVEREAVERELQKRVPLNEVERAGRARDSGADRAAETRPPARPSIDPREAVVVGKLVEHGPARYKHDPNESASYYVTLETAAGRRSHWGVGLQEAFEKSVTRPSVGDEVGIQQTGSRPVTVSVQVKDDEGLNVGERTLDTHRNAWIVEKAEYFRQPERYQTQRPDRAKSAAADDRVDRRDAVQGRADGSLDRQRFETARAFRNGQSAKEAVVREHPELAAAFATVRVAELFAKQQWEKPDDRDAFVKYVREDLTRRIENGESIPSPKIKETVNRSVNRTIDTVPKTPPEQRIARVKELPDRGQGLARV